MSTDKKVTKSVSLTKKLNKNHVYFPVNRTRRFMNDKVLYNRKVTQKTAAYMCILLEVVTRHILVNAQMDRLEKRVNSNKSSPQLTEYDIMDQYKGHTDLILLSNPMKKRKKKKEEDEKSESE